MMRRQSKPFVTEYKTPNRRTKAAAGQQTAPDNKAKSSDAPRATGWPQPDDADGGYTAALAAADALFSNRGNARPAQRTSGADEAAALFANNGDEAVPPEQGDGAGGRGRILQAIEASLPEAADAEEDAAPPRRARKPRSASKAAPLLRDVETNAGATTEPAAEPIAEPDEPFEPHASVASASFIGESGSDEPAARAEMVSSVEARTRPVSADAPVRRRERFNWVRTKLRPGEKWKRRLPKVAW